MEFFIISMLNVLSYGLLLFMLSSGLTLIFSMMGVLNFAHASFYMLGAYVGYTVAQFVGFWPALVAAPLVVGALGALFERQFLRKVHKFGHVPELLITFGLSYVIVELVQLIWGRIAVEFHPPAALQGPVFTLINDSVKGLSLIWGTAPAALCSAADAAVRIVCSPFPATRGFMMLVALVMLASVWLLLTRTRIGAGPEGETVIFGITKADGKHLDKPTAAEDIFDGRTKDVGAFYGEVVRNGRYHVFGEWKDFQDYLAHKEITFTYTEIGTGPKGETVIYALNSATKKKGRPVALVEQFTRLRQVK